MSMLDNSQMLAVLQKFCGTPDCTTLQPDQVMNCRFLSLNASIQLLSFYMILPLPSPYWSPHSPLVVYAYASTPLPHLRPIVPTPTAHCLCPATIILAVTLAEGLWARAREPPALRSSPPSSLSSTLVERAMGEVGEGV
ncbi:hypothetical protein MUK42_35647 [Musa troglodytarum]|uniref:Uncharacterized protein n=1 Tax=Musa troglodytarum TaxID=320322 RepID=A0A9E7JBC7_9LILI|nr:hypothetical protein MUK42_35647 [Musa troglodytarum]